jgi:hypothetical protein
MKQIVCFIITCLLIVPCLGQNDTLNSFHVSVSLPYMNGFLIKSDNTKYNSWGFVGLSPEIEYGNSKKSWGIQIGIVNDYHTPLGKILYKGEYDVIRNYYLNILRNRNFSTILLINQYEFEIQSVFSYGIHLSKFHLRYSDENILNSIVTNGLGFYLRYKIFFSNRFFLNYEFSPTLLNFNPQPNIDYQHSMSFGLGIKI